MITCRDKMFKSDDSVDSVEVVNTFEDGVVQRLDELALKIVDGQLSVEEFKDKPGVPRMQPHGGVKMEQPRTLEITYYES